MELRFWCLFAGVVISTASLDAACCASNTNTDICSNTDTWISKAHVVSVISTNFFGQNSYYIYHTSIIKGGFFLPTVLKTPTSCGVDLKVGQEYLLAGQMGSFNRELWATQCDQFEHKTAPLLSEIPEKTIDSLLCNQNHPMG
ncbi:unnamed protein product, partial [Mesorhabditis belari]|uniref:NTR domain-containing protein n=1 Tax=Mesorhabditis belari TaxID=2138241 RepID=A0AAF3EUW0_9BILA